MERWESLSRARKTYREKIGESARTLRSRHSASRSLSTTAMSHLGEVNQTTYACARS